MPRSRMALASVIAAATCITVGYAVYLSLDPENYFHYDPEGRDAWHYHPLHVAVTCAMIIVEGFIAALALLATRPRSPLLRIGIALALFTPWTFLLSLSALHSPMHHMAHIVWTWILTLVLAIAGIRVVAQRLVSWWKSRPPNNSLDGARGGQ